VDAPGQGEASGQGEARTGKGTLILVVGPSGAGKDSVIDFARGKLADDARVMFVRRVVTRDAQAGAEDHASLDPAAFEQAKATGAFAFTWEAHGLNYGLPQAMNDHLAKGGVAIANGSRATLPALRELYPTLVVVLITVSRATLAQRLAARGRETPEEIEARLERAELYCDVGEHVEIGNDGPLDEAGGRLVEVVAGAMAACTGILKTC
jgi:ribose 1,5-bisphosphokinase